MAGAFHSVNKLSLNSILVFMLMVQPKLDFNHFQLGTYYSNQQATFTQSKNEEDQLQNISQNPPPGQHNKLVLIILQLRRPIYLTPLDYFVNPQLKTMYRKYLVVLMLHTIPSKLKDLCLQVAERHHGVGVAERAEQVVH